MFSEVRNLHSTRVVQFIHSSAPEYLLDKDSSAAPFTLDREGDNASIAFGCLRYLEIALQHPSCVAYDCIFACFRDKQLKEVVDHLSNHFLLQYSFDHFQEHWAHSGDQKQAILAELSRLVKRLRRHKQSIAFRLVERWLSCLAPPSDLQALYTDSVPLETAKPVCLCPYADGNDLKRQLMIIAAQNGQLQTVQLLLSLSADPILEALVAAISHNHLNVVELLLDANDLGGEGGYFDATFRLLGANTRSDHGVPDSGRTMLHLAVRSGSLDIVEALIRRGADSNVRGNFWETVPDTEAKGDGHADRLTPLQVAAQIGNSEIVRFLLANGADPNAHGGALNLAWSTGKEHIVRTLLDYGARNEILTVAFNTSMSQDVGARKPLPEREPTEMP